MQTYLFYDIETTGLSPDFDQVLQFAAIRTDLDLCEISRHQFYVRLSPDRVPSYQAIATHKITPTMIESGLTEYDAIRHIHALMNQPGTCSIGYNSLAFDDNFLRFSFHRYLLNPYTHQYANGCSRADLFLIILPFFNFLKQSLSWPEPLSLKLELLALAQGIDIGLAHDAMNDVMATLELARLLLKKHPKHWDYVMSLFNKKTELKIENYSSHLFVAPMFGYDSSFIAPVFVLGEHAVYKHKLLWRLDDPLWLDAINHSDVPELKIFRKKPGEQGFYWPLVDKYIQSWSPERLELINKSYAWCLKNKSKIANYIEPKLQELYPYINNLDVDSAIYQLGFKSRDLQGLCSLFHVADKLEKFRLISEFPDPYQEQAVRIMWRNFPDDLPSVYNSIISNYKAKIAAGMVNHQGIACEGNTVRLQQYLESDSDLAQEWLKCLV